MTTLSMDNILTMIEDLPNGKTLINSFKYKNLESMLDGINDINVKFCFGQQSLRIKQLSKLGFSVASVIFGEDAEALHDNVEMKFTRA